MDAPAPWFMLPIAIRIGKKQAGIEYQSFGYIKQQPFSRMKYFGLKFLQIGFPWE